MKIILFVILTFTSTLAIAQTSIKSGVYNWSDQKADADGTRKFFTGETTYFQSFTVSAVTLAPNKKDQPSLTTKDVEQLIIVKEGTLKVIINTEFKVLGPGSVAHIMPGDMHNFENAEKTETTFYHLVFNSKSNEDSERGKVNGGSFAINWNDVEKIKTERGGRRNFYDRPTSMTTDFEMHVTTLNEGLASHAAHTHPQEEIVLLLSGNARMQIGDKYYEAVSGAVIFVTSGVLHGIQNSGKGECEYFAFQWK